MKIIKANQVPSIRNTFLLMFVSILGYNVSYAQVDYSVVSVNEETGIDFTKISSDNDYVCMPEVSRNSNGANWWSNKVIGVTKDGGRIAYLSFRNNATNVFIKDLSKTGVSKQRTNRQSVLDFSYSPDGKTICFSEQNGKTTRIFTTDAENGYVCRQITSNEKDYAPCFSTDMKQIFFSRQEKNGTSIWSYNVQNNFLSNFTKGMNAVSVNNDVVLCVRPSSNNFYEIWRINYSTGTEECIISDVNHSFTTPSISPDGQWVLFVGSSKLMNGNRAYWNTDIFVARMDGSQLTQLTYHAADDLSPVWSKDGRYIYFVSQRGSTEGTANIWRMNFIVK